MLDIGGYIFKS